MNESWHIWMSHVARVTFHTWEWVTPHAYAWARHTGMSYGTYEGVMAHTNESWHMWMSHSTHEWVMAHVHIAETMLGGDRPSARSRAHFRGTPRRTYIAQKKNLIYLYIISAKRALHPALHPVPGYVVASICRLLKIICPFCKRAL